MLSSSRFAEQAELTAKVDAVCRVKRYGRQQNGATNSRGDQPRKKQGRLRIFDSFIFSPFFIRERVPTPT